MSEGLKQYHIVLDDEGAAEVSEAAAYLKREAPHYVDKWIDGLEEAIASLEYLPNRCGIAPERHISARHCVISSTSHIASFSASKKGRGLCASSISDTQGVACWANRMQTPPLTLAVEAHAHKIGG